MNDAERRKYIKERQNTSTFWKVVHIFGSLGLAIFLLFTIALACAIATFYESNFDSRVAQAYIYKAPWFVMWLGLLSLNLICAALTRWPWQRKHIGFVVTHAGIVTLLIGSVISLFFGYDANIRLDKGMPPQSRLVEDHTIILFEGPRSKGIYSTDFEVRVMQPTEKRPRKLEVPEREKLRLVVDRYSDSLMAVQELIADQSFGIASGIQLEMQSEVMGQTLRIPLLSTPNEARFYDLFGLAKIEWVDDFPDLEQEIPGEPFRETIMALAALPEQPILHNTTGKMTGYNFLLIPGREDRADLQLLMLDPHGHETIYNLKEVLGEHFYLEHEGNEIQVHVMDYWPDFKMLDGKPTTLSDEPNNPAVLVMLHGERKKNVKPAMFLQVDDAGVIKFEVRRGSVVEQQGEFHKGDVIMPGWADWRITLQDFFPKARMISRAVERDVRAVNQQAQMDSSVMMGVRARLEHVDGRKSEDTWLTLGNPQYIKLGYEEIMVGFSMKTRSIPFGVQLTNFEVPRDPGTDTPANYISDVRFTKMTDSGEQTKEVRIEMNSPASFPGGLFALLTGINYKFSQAGWDPNNLNQTTLQVLYDPVGWLFKWVGSFMMCVGIYMLFYMRGSPRKKVVR